MNTGLIIADTKCEVFIALEEVGRKIKNILHSSVFKILTFSVNNQVIIIIGTK